ncbi:carbohydrate porin [Roseibium sp.]|uniref:carbohydrate porin n=1 Tax=Roseibium sp. TaxID=1936156 RepID=UPI003A98768D
MLRCLTPIKAAFCLSLIFAVGEGKAEETQPDSPSAKPLLSRPSLLAGPGGPKEYLKDRGIGFDLRWTGFNQGVVKGDGDKSWRFGGKVDLLFLIDAHKLGLWEGLSVSFHQEWLHGHDANTQGEGAQIPSNTAFAFPSLGGYDYDTSITVTQAFGDNASLTLGKFNMLDAAARTPLLGGGGLDTFMNLGLAAPISGVTPAYLLGGLFSYKTAPATFNLFIYDPRNAQDWDVIRNPFAEGFTTSLSATVPLTVAGRSGFHTFRGVYSTQEGYDLRDIPQLGLPPELQDEPRKKANPWYLSYAFQQYLFHDPDNPGKGWGVFGEVGLSNGNPNPAESHFFIGFGGDSFLPGRSEDRWGIAYFRYKVDSDLSQAARDDLGFDLTTESGIEAYYNLAVTPWFRVTGDIQLIDPFPANKERAIMAGMRTQIRF